MGLRGPPKRFTEQTHVGLTELQKLFLQVGAVIGNESEATFLRRLINSELRNLEEARNGEVEEGSDPRADQNASEWG